MLRMLNNSKSAMMAEQEKLDCISNNIANVETNGYKRTDVNFSDLMYESLQRNGYPVSEGLTKEPMVGSGVKAGKWIRDNSQGIPTNTGCNTNFCINGDGYFRVTRADGSSAYTRCGDFNLNSQGEIVDKEGNRLEILGANGNNINSPGNGTSGTFKNDNFTVKSDGTVLVKNSKGTFTEAGKLNIYSPQGQEALRSVGDNLYETVNGAAMQVSKNATIMQGFVEGSNVDTAKEITEMLMTQRAFELGSRGLKTADDMWSMVNNIRGR